MANSKNFQFILPNCKIFARGGGANPKIFTVHHGLSREGDQWREAERSIERLDSHVAS